MALVHRLIGKAAQLYWWVRRPRTLGVRGLVIDGGGGIALVRHSYRGGWYLPGGGVKKGESLGDALARELREEIALTGVKIERVLGVYHNRREYKDDHVVVFVARVGGETPVQFDNLEIEAADWFPLDALPDGLTPATARRIDEYRRGATGSGAW